MNWFVSILVALISGLAGLLLAGFIANSCVSWYRISSQEGESGYFVIFMALLGSFVGFLLGLIVARSIACCYAPGFGFEVMGALVAVLVVSAIVAWACRTLADIPPKLDGCELFLEVEFRFPDSYGPETQPTSDGDWQYTFASLSGNTRRKHCDGRIQQTAARYENGQWIVPTQVELFTERGKRSVTLARRDAKEVMGFLLPLPARPSAAFENWSDWLPRQQANGQAWPSTKMSCRFRVQKEPSPSNSN